MMCNRSGCDRAAAVRGLCHRDYMRLRRRGSPDAVGPKGARPARPLLERIEALSVPSGDCRLWTRSTNADGYGRIMVGSRSDGTRHLMQAHRAAFEAYHGVKLTDDEHVLHTCDTPPCVARAHLFLGDQAANMADMKAKGRGRSGNSKRKHD